MKKSLIALAVAGVVSAPAFAATSNVDIYGVMSYSVDRVNTDDSTIDDTDFVTGRDNVSRIGFKGSEDLGGGLSAIWQIESQLTTGAGTLASRNTFVGLKGGFGTVVLGQHDTPYKMATGRLDPFADTVADYNAIMGRSSGATASNLFDVRANQTVAYISPSFSGLTVAAAIIQTKTIEAAAADDDTSGWSMSGTYDNGPLFATAAYEKHSNMLGAAAADAISAWKLGVGYAFGNAKIGAAYEDISGGDTNGATVGGEANARSAWYLSGQYNMGAIALKAAYGKAGDSDAAATNDDGAKFYALGADYSLSKRTTVYGVYTKLSNDGTAVAGGTYDLTPYAAAVTGNSPSAFSVGVKHTF